MAQDNTAKRMFVCLFFVFVLLSFFLMQTLYLKKKGEVLIIEKNIERKKERKKERTKERKTKKQWKKERKKQWKKERNKQTMEERKKERKKHFLHHVSNYKYV